MRSEERRVGRGRRDCGQHEIRRTKHIEREISKNNQVLLVYPLVEHSEVLEYQSIEEARGYWENKFENVYVTHGKDKEKEEVKNKMQIGVFQDIQKS